MSRLNRDWHARNRMPENANLEQRIDWHLAHAQHCACRPVPERIREVLRSRGLGVPAQVAED